MATQGPLDKIFERLHALAVGVTRTRQVNYCNVASITIMILDWLLTFEMEVSLVWPSRWNITKVLYFLARYLPFIDTSMVMYHQFGYSLSESMCRFTYEYAAWMFIVGITCAELVLTLRTWAVWGKDRKLTYGLTALFCAVFATGFVIMGIYLKATAHEVSPVPKLLGCLVKDTNTILSACYILLMAYDALILILMVIRGYEAFRQGGDSHLMRVVYSDGIIYYIYLFGLSLLNTVIILKLPSDYVNLLVMMERVIHSVLACRVVLHIREQGRKENKRRDEELFGSVQIMSLHRQPLQLQSHQQKSNTTASAITVSREVFVVR